MSDADFTLKPPSPAEVEAEAQRLRDNGNEMPYAAYWTLLWVMGYGVGPPSEIFINDEQSAPDKGAT